MRPAKHPTSERRDDPNETAGAARCDNGRTRIYPEVLAAWRNPHGASASAVSPPSADRQKAAEAQEGLSEAAP